MGYVYPTSASSELMSTSFMSTSSDDKVKEVTAEVIYKLLKENKMEAVIFCLIMFFCYLILVFKKNISRYIKKKLHFTPQQPEQPEQLQQHHLIDESLA